MDHCHVIASFQGAILSVDHVHPLIGLDSKGGNETKVCFVIEGLQRFLKEEEYIDDKGLVKEKIPKMRKLAMFIILNTNLTVINGMVDITGFEPLMWTIPSLPKHLMCEMIWQLHMETFLYEIIPKCIPQIGMEVAEAFLENFKYFSPIESLSKLENISKACYALICRMNCYKIEDNMALKSTLTSICETFKSFTKFYTEPPNSHMLNVLSTDEVYKYKGQRYKSILNLVHSCLSMYVKDTNPSSDDPIYKATYRASILQNTMGKICDSPCRLLLTCVDNCNLHLLDVVKELIMDISVDLFCSWSEFEEGDKTVQQAIGESCHKALVSIKSNETIANHPVAAMLKQMAREPTNIKDIINAMDASTILDKINNSDIVESVEYIHALVHREQLLRDLELVSVVNDFMSMYDESECFQLFRVFENVAIDTTDPEHRQLLLSTKINLFQKCSVVNKHKIMKDHFKEKTFNNVKMEEDFDSRLNTMFNKFVGDIDVDFTDVFTLFYQNPRKVYTKIFGLATQNTKLIEPMSKLIQLLREYSEYCYNTETEPCIITVIKFVINKCLQDGYICNIINFICELKINNIISNSQLLMLVVMPCLHEALQAKDVDKINVQIELLTTALPVEDFMPYRPPILIMMAQIMETVRLRHLVTFRLLAMKVLQKVINLVKSIIASYSDGIPATEERWLRQKLQSIKFHMLNFYYFKPLWKRDNKCYFDTVMNTELHEINLGRMTAQLSMAIAFITLEEWCEIYDNFIENHVSAMDAMRLFHAAVKIVTIKIGKHRDMQKPLNCLIYLYSNLIHIIKRKFLIEPLSNDRVMCCCTMLADNLKMTDPRDVNEIATVVMPLFAYLAERKNDYSVDVPKCFVGSKFLPIVNKYIPSDHVE